MLGATGGPGSLPRRDEPAGGWPPRPGCSVQPRPSPEAAPRAGTSVLPRPAETDLTGVDRATSVSGSPLNVGRNGRARLSCGGRTQRASASASPRYASERDSQSRHCQSTTVACRTKGRGGCGWCGRIGGVSGGLSPPEHLLRATAPGGSARWRDSTAIVVERFQFEDNFCRVRSDPVPDLRITLCSALCTVVWARSGPLLFLFRDIPRISYQAARER